jgi:hypothetical protein
MRPRSKPAPKKAALRDIEQAEAAALYRAIVVPARRLDPANFGDLPDKEKSLEKMAALRLQSILDEVARTGSGPPWLVPTWREILANAGMIEVR